MTFEPSTFTGAVVVALSIAATGFGAGAVHADPPIPPTSPTSSPTATSSPTPTSSPPPSPAASPPAPSPTLAPPERDVVSAPGHGGPMPPDAVVPVWAPPAPPPPVWAPWLPVVWNSELNAWGVWWNGSFQPL